MVLVGTAEHCLVLRSFYGDDTHFQAAWGLGVSFLTRASLLKLGWNCAMRHGPVALRSCPMTPETRVSSFGTAAEQI